MAESEEEISKLICWVSDTTLAAMEDAAALEGLSKTQAVNWAIQIFCLLVAERQLGHRVYVGPSRLRSGELTWSPR